MKRKIYKYSIPIEDNFILTLPAGAWILCVQSQNDKPFIWAVIDPDMKDVKPTKFILVGTGHPFDVENQNYIGTFQLMDGGLVYHLFYEAI